MKIPRFAPVQLDEKYFKARRTMKLTEFHPDTKWVCYEDIEDDHMVRVAPDYAVTRYDSVRVPRTLVTVIEDASVEA